MKIDTLLDKLVISGVDDWIMACEVASVAKFEGRASSESDSRNLSIQLIQEVLERGLMEIGDVTEGGFRTWNVSIEEAMERVQREWLALPEGPNLGDVCWLANTKKGDERANFLVSQAP
jgi:hypothetical protein